MTYRPLAVGNGTTFDTVGDPRIGAAAGDIPEASVAGLTASLAAKLAGVKADTAPATPATNDVWLDTSGAAGVWKIWNGSAWVAFSGGAPVVVTSTTGSPTITSDASYTYYKFTGSGTLVVGTEGVAEVLLVSGGASGSNTNQGPGSGGTWVLGQHVLPAGTLTVTVGAGGTGSTYSGAPGRPSSLGTLSTSYSPITSPTTLTLTSSTGGSSVEYAKANQASPVANKGEGGAATSVIAGSTGVVIVRVSN